MYVRSRSAGGRGLLVYLLAPSRSLVVVMVWTTYLCISRGHCSHTRACTQISLFLPSQTSVRVVATRNKNSNKRHRTDESDGEGDAEVEIVSKESARADFLTNKLPAVVKPFVQPCKAIQSSQKITSSTSFRVLSPCFPHASNIGYFRMQLYNSRSLFTYSFDQILYASPLH